MTPLPKHSKEDEKIINPILMPFVLFDTEKSPLLPGIISE